MSLKPIPNQGLQVAEPEFLPLKAYQSGGFYWDGEAQLVIRSMLGDFLPPLVQTWPEGKRTGLFQLPEAGREVLCQSRPASTRHPIPARQLRQLSRRLENFKRKADSRETTPHNRYLIQQFKLPDFDQDPDLYRLSGGFWNRRLHVLWGCERAAESSLSPAAALAKLPATPAFHLPKKYLWWLAALSALALLLLLLWWHWPGKHNDSLTAKTSLTPTTVPHPPRPEQLRAPNPDPSPNKDGESGNNGASVPGGPNAPAPPGTGSNELPPAVAASITASDSPPRSGTKEPGEPIKSANSRKKFQPPPASPSTPAAVPPSPPVPSPTDPPPGPTLPVTPKPTVPPKTEVSIGGLRIGIIGQHLLPDGRVEIQLDVSDSSMSKGVPQVAAWEVDRTNEPGASNLTVRIVRRPTQQ